ncbi:SusC/RagA family TonB-linked outer membrane protein [Riemerella anatipestifer]|uniref:SusC/RagA family TonB-linked outer membrane protein n=1 Tax=Riemerella anatipestifer TaxID=34085 RepID=UPI00069C9B24|nr:SusC/RagA family TonB-linked outer membrane protein [Riemerella anatipestifer]MDY3318993.1 SusC/RagA family TonB-linked outer membrane protein [Riemerella anatipestifer]MDY3325264.1 SusC/RagA family TonB-linked outer membrane protein [Riemerella anatipestifer]MDY3352746.1 SusC/RagA family TonB-linked outer membrane protein [Riemerella anatipestifer]MDY3536612.1 SusC/RagA family TonB-linked outer membrane protein [Riemerella anatipestifer]
MKKLTTSVLAVVLASSFVTVDAQKVKKDTVKTKDIEGVVVTALGIKREKKALGYSVSDLGGDNLKKSGEANVIQGLAGKVSGVQVTGSAGTPGAGSKIIIRGEKSILLDSQPLIVLDGMIIDNSTTQSAPGDYAYNANLSGVNNSNRALDINPEDIETVSVLKGGAAAALYGEKARDGVIIYTTKRGRKRKGIGIDLAFSNEYNSVSKLPDLQRVYAQGVGGVFNSGTPNSWGPKISSIKGAESYDNVGNFFRLGTGFNTDLSLYGGSDVGSFRVSFNHLDQEGMIPNSSLKKSTVRVAGDLKITDKIKIGGSSQYSITTGVKTQNGSNVAGIMLGLLRAPASYDLRNYMDVSGNQQNYYDFYDNPYFTAYYNPFNDEVKRLLLNANVAYNHSKYFNTNLRFGVDTWTDNRRQVFAVGSVGNDNADRKGQVNLNDLNFQSYSADLLFNGGVDILQDNWLALNYNAGGSVYSNFYRDNFSRGRELGVPGLYNLGNATELYASNYYSSKITQSLFGQFEFDVKNQLFLTLTGRNDWSSTNSKVYRSLFYPSLSASWLLDKTLKLPSWVNMAKVRYSWAQVGKTPTEYGTNTYFRKVTHTDGFTGGLSFPYGEVNGYGYSGTLGNADLRPEISTENEFGVELKFFGRFNLSAAHYRGTVSDLLLYMPVADGAGFSSRFSNSGELEFKGYEVELGYDVVKSDNFKWYVGANWSMNRNKVTKLAEYVDEVSLESAFTSIGSFAIVGQPLGAFYGTRYLRDSSGNVLINEDSKSSRYGLPLLDSSTGNIGNPTPDWIGGVRTNVQLGDFFASALLERRQGGDVYNGTLARLNRLGVTAASAENREGTYIVPGVLASGQPNNIAISANKYFTNYLGDAGGAAEQFVEKVNWWRLRDVTVGYKLSSLLKRYNINLLQDAEISFTGRNLWLDTNYKGVDPETSLTGAGSRINGLDYFNNAGSKSYIVTLRLKF